MDERLFLSYLMKYDKYTDIIEHSGVPGMSWYHHDPNRRQQGEKAYVKGKDTEGFVVKSLMNYRKKKKEAEEAEKENQDGTIGGLGDFFGDLQKASKNMNDSFADRRREKDEETGLYLKNREFTEEEDCALINPHLKRVGSFEVGKPLFSMVDEGDGAYSMNCISCSISYEMRRRGYDVESVPDKIGKKSPQVDDLFPGAERRELYNINSKYSDYGKYVDDWFRDKRNPTMADVDQVYTDYVDQAVKKSVNRLASQGDGARGMLALTVWGGGHAVHYSVDNGNVTITDSQVNKQQDAYDYLVDFGASKVSYYRLDNTSPKTNLLDRFVRNRE